MQPREWLKVLSALPRSVVASKRFRTRPMQAIIDVSMKCPASCLYCSTWRIEHENLTTAQLTGIIDKLHRMGVVVLTLSGGEPLVRRDLADLVGRAHGHGMLVNTITSGLVGKAEVFNRLMANGLATLTFTIDGVTREMHESFRSGTNFEKVIGAVKTAQAVRAEGGFSTRINSQTVITRHNIHALEAIAEMVHGLGVDHCSFQPVWPTVDFDHFVDKFGFDGRDADLLIQARERLRRVPHANLKEFIELLPDFYLDYPKIQREIECYAGRAFVHVNYKGELLPCAFYPEAFGSLLEREPEELLEGAHHARLLQEAAAQSTCGGCSLTCHMERNIMMRGLTRPATLWQLVTDRFARRTRAPQKAAS